MKTMSYRLYCKIKAADDRPHGKANGGTPPVRVGISTSLNNDTACTNYSVERPEPTHHNHRRVSTAGLRMRGAPAPCVLCVHPYSTILPPHWRQTRIDVARAHAILSKSKGCPASVRTRSVSHSCSHIVHRAMRGLPACRERRVY